MEIDPEKHGPAEEQADSSRQNESFLDSLGFGGQSSTREESDGDSDGLILSSSLEEVELPGANCIPMPRVWGLENLVVRPAAKRQLSDPLNGEREEEITAEWRDGRPLDEGIIDASVAFDIPPNEMDERVEEPVEYRDEVSYGSGRKDLQPPHSLELLHLHCPDCEGELVLKSEHLGIEGQCVWCELPIVAERSGDQGEVRVFPISREDRGNETSEFGSEHSAPQPYPADESEDTDYAAHIPPSFPEEEEEDYSALEAESFETAETCEEESFPGGYDEQFDSYEAEPSELQEVNAFGEEEESPADSFSSSMEALDALEECEERDVAESVVEAGPALGIGAETFEEEVAEVVSPAGAVGFGSLSPAVEQEDTDDESRGFTESYEEAPVEDFEESLEQVSPFGEELEQPEETEGAFGNGFGLAAQAESYPGYDASGEEAETATSFGQVPLDPEQTEEEEESILPANFSHPEEEPEIQQDEPEAPAGFGAITGEPEGISDAGVETVETCQEEELSVQDLAFVGDDEPAPTPGFGTPPVFPAPPEETEPEGFPTSLQPFEAESEDQPAEMGAENSPWGFPGKDADHPGEEKNAFGFFGTPGEDDAEAEGEAEIESFGEATADQEEAGELFGGFSGGFVGAEANAGEPESNEFETAEEMEVLASEPVAEAAFSEGGNMWGDEIGEEEGENTSASQFEGGSLFPEVSPVESPAWEINDEEESEIDGESAASGFEFASDPGGESGQMENGFASETPLEGIFSADPDAVMEKAEEATAVASAPPAVKKRGKGKIAFLLVVLGLATGIGVASFLLPVDDYVDMARAFVEEKMSQVSDLQGNSGVPVPPAQEGKPNP